MKKMDLFPAKNPNPVLSVEKSGTVLYSNGAGEPLLHEWGVEVGEKLPSYIQDFVQRVISQDNPEKIEVKVGKRVYLIVFHPLPEEKYVSISGFDISDQKEFEEKLRESENRYRNIIETSVEGIWIFNAVSETIYVNEKMAEMLGYKLEEMIGRFIWDFAYEEDKDIFQIKLANRKQGIDEVYELKLIRKDGSPLWISVSAKGLFDEAGKFAGSVGMFTDTTERKRAEEALLESKASIESIFRSSPVGIGVVVNRRIKEANERLCEMTGYSREELLGKSALMLYPTAEEYERVGSAKYGMIGERGTGYVETRWQRKDGSIVDILLSSSPIVLGDLSGEITFTALDITERKHAEEALKKAHDTLEDKVKQRTAELEEAYSSMTESEGRLAEAQKMAHIGNWDWDIATDKAYWSNELYRIFGRDPQELAPPYNEYLSYVHPDDRDYADNAHKKALNGKPFSIDHRIILANGEERIVHIQSETIFNDENIPIRLKGIVQDITERKRAEEKIQTMANAVESSSDAIITVSLDGIITSWNKAAEQVYGYSAQEVIGKSVSILAPSHLREETKKLTEMVIQGEKVHQYETLRLRKDDTIINVSITLSPVFDINGKLVAISGIVRDVTERIKAEEAMRESEARLRRFYELSMVGMFYYNLDGSINDSNDKLLEIVGYTREDLHAGRVKWDKMTPPEYRHLDEYALAELESTGVSTPYEKEYIRKDGSRVSVIVGSATFDQSRNEGIAFVLDITEKKKAEKALENIEIARKKEIHHRIKNNLQVISSLLDLQADKFDDPKVIEAFRESQNRVISMALIHEELYKGEGTDTLNFSTYIRELAENLFHTYCLNSKNIRLCMDMEENALFNMDTAVPLGIIINELVSNSLKHAFPGGERGEIRIKLHREKDGKHEKEGNKSTSFTLTVSDNGIGIPENLDIEELDSLGIQLITTLVDQLDGELELKRNNGAEFVIRFSVTEER